MTKLSILPMCLLVFHLCAFLIIHQCSSCGIVGSLNLTQLKGVWQVVGNNSHYEINLCEPLSYASSVQQQKCKNSSVCHFINGSAYSMGYYISDMSKLIIPGTSPNQPTGLYLHTSVPCGKGAENFRSAIMFRCGRNIGSPEVSMYGACQATFQWETSAACGKPPDRSDVPCYIINPQGKKVDLSHLIKYRGAYHVQTFNLSAQLVINVCSDINPDDSINKCPKGSAACRIIGDEYVSFGSPIDGIKQTNEGISLTYESNSKIAGCLFKPKTTIKFLCPARLKNRPPYVLSQSNCHYQIVWETEYACPEEQLTGDTAHCQFNLENNGVHIDLSPLRIENGQYHTVYTKEGEKPKDFYLNVCSGIAMPCNSTTPKKYFTACEVDSTNNKSVIIGTKLDSELRFADGELFLTYARGVECGSGLTKTVIHFICSINETDPTPQYITTKSENCIKFFEFKTQYACTRSSSDVTCFVNANNSTIDLGRLKRTEGSAWHALDETDSPTKGKMLYLLNVCGDIATLQVDTQCEPGAAICAINNKGEYLNLGRFQSPPVYDSDSKLVSLEYTNGSSCNGDKTWHSRIQFTCKLGQVMHQPFLININVKECLYEFEWHTAEACPLGWLAGSGCKVYHPVIGINFDLTPLRNTYVLETETQKYHIGICQPAFPVPCTPHPGQTVGICKEEKNKKGDAMVVGEHNDKLSYFNGYIRLDYQNSVIGSDATIFFFCDSTAGIGRPQIMENVNNTFTFHWNTDVVCEHATSSDCIVHDPVTHRLYDLSRLSFENRNWMISSWDKKLKFYLNICQPLVHRQYCDIGAAACAVNMENGTETLFLTSIGKATQNPVLSSEGHLQLYYTDGKACVAHGEKTTYSTIIHFVCRKGATEAGPIYLGNIGKCRYQFLWSTPSACPIEEIVVKDSCELTDPDTGFVFDLTPLRLTTNPYVVKMPDRTFEMNICGPVVNGCVDHSANHANPSVCAINGNVVTNLADANYTLKYSEEKELLLVYRKQTPSDTEVIIKFPCSTTLAHSNPEFVRQEGNKYFFTMSTALTCQSNPICSFFDKRDNEYDLTPLSKSNGFNWVVPDSRSGYEDLRYQINFCMPLNRVSLNKCPGGTTVACQTNIRETEGFSLGSLSTTPEVSEDGVISVHYGDGSPCRNGAFKRSTTINLYCSAKQYPLTFVGESPECEYMFSMQTPAACPLHTSQGNDCTVTEPIYGHTFDLNPLKNVVQNITAGQYSYLLTVCNHLSSPDFCKYAGVCQLKPSDPTFSKSLGIPSSSLVYHKGVISLEYHFGAGNCRGKYNRSALITFTCDHDTTKSQGNLSFVSEGDDCSYLFEYPTVHACTPFNTIDCSTEDRAGNVYDLTDLSLTNDNYYVKDAFSTSNSFVINVCRSVVHKPDSLCPYTASACLINSTNKDPTKRALSIGQPERGPYFDEETHNLRIRYFSGEPCNVGGSSARFYETVIDFYCDHEKLHSTPEFVGSDDCTYFFDWTTAFACPIKNKTPPENDCSVSDPLTGYLFNLTSLKSEKPYKVEFENHIYSLNICGSMKNAPCGSQAGICQEESSDISARSWNAGKANSNLMLRDKVLFLNYSGGDTCHGTFQRNTIIEFRCGNGVGTPKFVHETSNCSYYFEWETDLACSEFIHCAVKNHTDTIELAALSNGYHVATSDVDENKAKYYISVCGPLGMIPGVRCPPEAAICKVDENVSEGQSLGISALPPFLDFNGDPTVLFINGSVCQSESSLVYRSRIILLCNPDEYIGTPVLVDIMEKGCVYIFQWGTSLVCPSTATTTPLPPAECIYKNSERGIYFDLSSIRKQGSYYEVKESTDEKDGTYLLNVCDTVSSSKLQNCNMSGVCYQNNATGATLNHGLVSTQAMTYDNDKLKLVLHNGDDCPSGYGGKRTSEIVFTCKPEAGIGKPMFFKKYTCLVVFMWETNLVCRNYIHQCAFDFDGRQFDLHQLSSLSHNWKTTDNHNNTYWFNLCRGIQQNSDTMGCPPSAAVCMKDNKGSHMPLGMVYTMKAKKTNNSGILLTYNSQSSQPCSHVPSSESINATTRIFMWCGKNLGSPRLMTSGPDAQCFYDFVWETNIACPQNTYEGMLMKNGVLWDPKMEFGFNISDILNKTYNVSGFSRTENYTYLINLSGINTLGTGLTTTCSAAAVCQTKPGTSFSRDIGSFSTIKFLKKGSEVHLNLTSLQRGCGKTKERNVTAVFSLQCSSAAGLGKPVFMYESGGCDYMFYWETIAVCPDLKRLVWLNSTTDGSINPNPQVQIIKPSTSHRIPVIFTVIFVFIIGFIAIFILSSKERRVIAASKFNMCFKRATIPRFRYKRCDNEKCVLVDCSEPKNIYRGNEDDDNLLL